MDENIINITSTYSENEYTKIKEAIENELFNIFKKYYN